MRRIAQNLGLIGEKRIPDFEIPLLPEDLERLKAFQESEFWDREAGPTTDIWDKYSEVSGTSFYWKKSRLWYSDTKHGLDKQYPSLFGYQRPQPVGQRLKRALLKRLGAWHGPLLFDAQSLFKKGELSYRALENISMIQSSLVTIYPVHISMISRRRSCLQE